MFSCLNEAKLNFVNSFLMVVGKCKGKMKGEVFNKMNEDFVMSS